MKHATNVMKRISLLVTLLYTNNETYLYLVIKILVNFNYNIVLVYKYIMKRTCISLSNFYLMAFV